MHNSLEIDVKDYGFVVCIAGEGGEDVYTVEEYALEDPLDVLAEVLRFLGYDEDTRDTVIELLDEDVAYVLTDKGREELTKIDSAQAAQDWKQADRDWEIRRLEAEIAALKRGSGRGVEWRERGPYWDTTCSMHPRPIQVGKRDDDGTAG